MEWFPESKDHLPLTWWKQTPVYLAMVIALGGVASLVLTTLVMAVNPGWLMPFMFCLHYLLSGWIWTPMTYVLVNPPISTTQVLWFLLGSYMLYRFGEAIERHLGRWSFVKLLICLWLAPPLVLSLIGLLGPKGWLAVGINPLEFGVFLAFAALYPSVRISLIVVELEVWMLAAIYVAAEVLIALAYQTWPSLFISAAELGAAVTYIRYEQGRLQLSSFKFWQRRKKRPDPKLEVYRPDKRSSPPPAPRAGKESADVDAILEKISRHGMASLTPEERQALEKASERLGKKGR